MVVSTHLKNMLVKLDHVPKFRDENDKYLKPPPRFYISSNNDDFWGDALNKKTTGRCLLFLQTQTQVTVMDTLCGHSPNNFQTSALLEETVSVRCEVHCELGNVDATRWKSEGVSLTPLGF